MNTWEPNEAELAAIRAEYAKGATDSQWTLFISECKNRNLRPGVHLVFQLRRTKEYDADTGAYIWVQKPYWITTIAALRLIIERTGKYAGQTPPEYIYLDDNGEPSIISLIPLPQKGSTQLPREPWAVRVGIKRRDFDEPIIGLSRFESVASFTKTDKGLVLSSMYAKRGPEMTAKCAEADGIRKAAPEEAGSYYLSEEIKSEEETSSGTFIPASVVTLPPPVPKVNQTPAQPVEAPRPNEQPKVEYQVKEVPATLPEHAGSTLVVQTAGQQLAERQEAVKAVVAANPSLKPASELPPPVKKKGGRPKKPAESPVNGQPAPVDQGITQADIDNAAKPAPVVDEAANQAAAQEFVESLNPTPTKEEQAGFSSRVRALAAAGANTQDLRNYILAVGHKDEPKQLTVANWNDALTRLETALGEGKDKLLEATKNAPLPAF